MGKFLLQWLVTLISCHCISSMANELLPVAQFGDNPGNVSMFVYIPENIPDNASLVVSLHGCTQNAETYSQAGWLSLADEHKFYLIFPQQSPFNNPLSCWNWFEADNLIRGQGEIQSIVNMVKHFQTLRSIDTDRIFIEGLSAGGFLTPVILANYPDIFAAGATNAGGPAFCARTKKYFWDLYSFWYSYQAKLNFDKCANGIDRTPEAWGDLVREHGLNNHSGRWPSLSIWHGVSDDVVAIENQTELLEQWSNVLSIDLIVDQQQELNTPAGVIHKQYQNGQGEILLETWTVPNMEHGTAIDAATDNRCGTPSEYVLDEGICTMEKIAEFWGLF